MTLPRLAPSKSKAEFYQRLGLSESIDAHKQLYEAMKVGSEVYFCEKMKLKSFNRQKLALAGDGWGRTR